MSQFKMFHERQPDGAHFVAVTDPGSPLVDLASERGFRHVFENDPDIGGRYSVMSYFGLVPAALSTGIGSQVQQPLACVIVGGMLLSPICSLLVIPVLARFWMPTIKKTGIVREAVAEY